VDRGEFLKTTGLASANLLFVRYANLCLAVRNIRFGVITDLHHDIMHDGIDRLSAFIKEMNAEKPDFIIQGGDFCIPKKSKLPLMDVWKQFNGPKYHVIGNHDNDGGYKHEQVLEFWDASAKYYFFDVKGSHFVLLNGNEYNESANRSKGYSRYISPAQIEWLRKDLRETSYPTVIFCHQVLDNDAGGLESGTLLRYTLERANKDAGLEKLILVLSGHHHQDYYNHINGIHYVQVNSASYQWLGYDFKEIRYFEEADDAHPNIKYTVPYRDPIWAMVEIDHKGKIIIKGRKAVFVGSSPEKSLVDQDSHIYPIVPYISDRKLG
jgi:calcineurin-like phosphoesterase family protein